MKIKKYFIFVISFLLVVSLFHSSTNPISIISETTTEKKNDYAFTQKVAGIESKTSSIPQLSQTFAWDDNGTIICNEDINWQEDIQICSDGAGGAIITWEDWRNGNRDIYAQKIDSNGNTQWGNGTMWGGVEDRNGTVICNAPMDQYLPQICSDGAKGAIITWYDFRNGASNCDIYAQRINKTGDTQWGDGTMWGGVEDRNGTIICNEDTMDQWDPHICSDGDYGAIITWHDERNSISKWDIYAQRINKTGDTQWGDGTMWGGVEDRNGTVICNAPQDQGVPQICSDGPRSAIITWEDKRNGNKDIYAQRINKTGDIQWGNGTMWGVVEDRNGTVICNAINDQYHQQICSDDAGGAIITWTDVRNKDKDVYAQRINKTGDTQWGDGTMWGVYQDRNGTAISNEDTDGQLDPQICSDGAEGAIITWTDWRSGTGDIYAQKIDSAGATKWGNGLFWGGVEDRNGTVICNEDNSWQDYPYICSDDAGGAIITWVDLRSGNGDIYAQKIDSAGATKWGNGTMWGDVEDRNGTVICNAPMDQYYQQICSDGAGGAIISWEDDRNGKKDIYAQKIKVVSGPPLPAADDDDEDDDKVTGAMLFLVVIIILASVGGIVLVVIVLIKKGVSKTKRG